LKPQRIIISFLLYGISFFTGSGGTAASAQVPQLFREDTVTICFMGDMMMHTRQLETALQKDGSYDFRSYFSLIQDRIKSADIAVANMEFTLAGEPYSGYPCFSAPDAYAEYLAKCGFDIFLTANNHILDKGSEGAMRTLEQYRKLHEEYGILITGSAEDEEAMRDNYPLKVRRKGMNFAFLNFTYGTNAGSTLHWPKIYYMGRRSDIQKALDCCRKDDWTIVLPHWGDEYVLHHSQTQEETAGWLIDRGADLIIGAHPHVVQDTCRIGGVPVAYSLGNAVSNMSAENTQLELMIEARIVRHGNGDMELLPLELTWLWCSRPGGFCNDYIVIPVEEYLDKAEEWNGRWDYDKMARTYERVKNKKQ
jgi:poly-gamma-glutamate synthesis protein (capsule biosynthesis protein)